MNLADLLEYTAKEFLDDRTDLLDGDPDEIWSDSFLVRQFNEAQRILTRRSWVIQDVGHATAGTIVLATGKSTYKIHKSVLRIHDGTPEDRDSPLARYEDVSLRTPHPHWDNDLAFDVNVPDTATPGRPVALATDAGTRLLRIYRTPSSVENGLRILLKVTRMPVTWLTLEDTDACPEVPEEYHQWLGDFAAGRALSLPNIDGQLKTDGKTILAEFAEHVKEARQDRQRAEMAPSRPAFTSTTATLGDRWGRF